MNWKWLLLSFSGRVSRKWYWLATLALVAIVIVAVLPIVLVADRFGPSLIALVPIALLALWICLAVSAKRLHDRDKSAWWLLIFYLVPNVLEAIGDHADRGLALVIYLASFAVSLWALVELGFLRGTQGPNRYGADPLQASPEAAVPAPH